LIKRVFEEYGKVNPRKTALNLHHHFITKGITHRMAKPIIKFDPGPLNCRLIPSLGWI
jgi:hypothetical protein